MKTVCILTAGRGVRLSEYSSLVNKALLPINKKAAISHIIDNFPNDTKIVVAVGHLKDQVKTFLKFCYPKRDIKFIEIKNYAGKGSGPGKSLLQCKKFLNKSFYFVSCDTIWKEKIYKKEKNNWMGVSKKLFFDPNHYCNLYSKNSKITLMKDKEFASKKFKHFIGLAYIKDYNLFWSAFKNMKKKAGEYQVTDGFRKLINSKIVKEKKLEWSDIGNLDNYNSTLQKYEKFNFRKKNEFIYLNKERIIKFINSKKKINRLNLRSKNNKSFPTITKKEGQFIQYKFISGKIFYEDASVKKFLKLLDFLSQKFWKKSSKININSACKKFYYIKTLKRINSFFKKYNMKKDTFLSINGKKIPNITKLIDLIPWKNIFKGVPSNFHGDLQFDNIISANKNFYLIDWREDFGGNLNYGDLYYDLAKLDGGIEMNYDLIKKGKFLIKERKNQVFYKFTSRNELMKKIKFEFDKFLKKNNYSQEKVEIIKCLIYLNMCPLHEAPFDKLLFSHGKLRLFGTLKKYGYIN
jgi:choline kinase